MQPARVAIVVVVTVSVAVVVVVVVVRVPWKMRNEHEHDEYMSTIEHRMRCDSGTVMVTGDCGLVSMAIWHTIWLCQCQLQLTQAASRGQREWQQWELHTPP